MPFQRLSLLLSGMTAARSLVHDLLLSVSTILEKLRSGGGKTLFVALPPHADRFPQILVKRIRAKRDSTP
jgi:hypothetical protein